MPIQQLADRLLELDLDSYRMTTLRPGRTLDSLSTTSGVGIVDQRLAARSCSCSGGGGGACTCIEGQCLNCICHIHED